MYPERYRLDLMRKTASAKATYDPVRSFYFEASDDSKAVTRAVQMRIFPSVDDCDVAYLFSPTHTPIWYARRDA